MNQTKNQSTDRSINQSVKQKQVTKQRHSHSMLQENKRVNNQSDKRVSVQATTQNQPINQQMKRTIHQ